MSAAIEPNLDWARAYVAGLNDEQRSMLKKMYEEHREAKKQQEVLESLTKQTPVTVDVVRSSTSPESQIGDDGAEITVKDVLLGKMKGAYQHRIQNAHFKPYRPRGSRERVYVDEHLYVFDKLSYDCKKRFYRCERRATCPARVHTPLDSDRVIHRVQTHNHPAPSAAELLHYDIDLSDARVGWLLYVNPANRHSSSFLTSKSDTEEENVYPMTNDENRKLVSLRIPDNFDRSSEKEIRQMELALTEFLLRQTQLRQELVDTKGNLPVFFPEAPKSQLVLFVARQGQQEDIFEMVQVAERNEKSIRAAIQKHFQLDSNRPLLVNVTAKIHIPLSQQMIDQWKTEEFIRVDVSNSKGWKIQKLAKIE